MTTAMDPDDVDCVFIIDSREVANLQATDPRRSRFLPAFAGGQLRSLTSLRVDSYLLEWIPDPSGQGLVVGVDGYYLDRGYWDDFWQRQRSGVKGAPPAPEDALPRRGYLEVTLDGFHA